MYKTNKPTRTSIKANKSYVGEAIEYKIDRMINNREPLKDPGVGLNYSERKQGVLPESDIRTDRFEIAVDATTKGEKLHKARRDERMGAKAKEGQKKEEGGESTTQSTDTTPTK